MVQNRCGAYTTDETLLEAPLLTLIAWMRERRLSPVELEDAHIRRIERVNPGLNALVAQRFDAAREEAALAEREYATAPRPRPLLGVPFTVKETTPVEGVPTTFGLPRFHDDAMTL